MSPARACACGPRPGPLVHATAGGWAHCRRSRPPCPCPCSAWEPSPGRLPGRQGITEALQAPAWPPLTSLPSLFRKIARGVLSAAGLPRLGLPGRTSCWSWDLAPGQPLEADTALCWLASRQTAAACLCAAVTWGPGPAGTRGTGSRDPGASLRPGVWHCCCCPAWLAACMEAEPALEPSAKRHKHDKHDRKHKKHKHKGKHRAKGEYREGEAEEPGSAAGGEQVPLRSAARLAAPPPQALLTGLHAGSRAGAGAQGQRCGGRRAARGGGPGRRAGCRGP